MDEELLNLPVNIIVRPPKTAEDVKQAFQVDAIWELFGVTKHYDKEQFFKASIQEETFSYCIFASEKIIRMIKRFIPPKKRTYIIDGTLRIVQQACFKKLLIVHIDFNEEQVFPFIFILMDKSTSIAYQHLFKYIDEKLLKLEASCFLTDFDIPLQITLRRMYPNVQVNSCWFHYCQAIRKDITTKHKELSAFVRNNCKASEYYHKFLAIVLLPAHFIEPAYIQLKVDIIKSEFPNSFFSPFLHYFEKRWLKKIGPEQLTVFNQSTKTTSNIEAFNDLLGSMLPKMSDFFKFVRILREEEFVNSRRFSLSTNGRKKRMLRSKRKSSLERADKINVTNKDLISGNINFKVFLERMVYQPHNICTEMEPIDDLLIDCSDASDTEEDEIEKKKVKNETKIINKEKLCIKCLVKFPNIILYPCEHAEMCHECHLKILAECVEAKRSTYSCPTCYQTVVDVMQIFQK